ncbi:MAG: TrkH family potassium uptake protein [Thermodesulfovibrionales bacterium]
MKERQVSTLRYAVRGRVLAKRLGDLCLGLAALQSVPLAASFLLGDFGFGLRFGMSFAFIALAGLGLSRVRAPQDIQVNESLALSAMIFVLTPFVFSYPMMYEGLPFVDALFEAVSGITTTGLSTTATVEDKSRAFLFARSWLQWSGGLGIVVLTVAILIQPGVSAKRLAYGEGEKTDMVVGTRIHAQRSLKVYLALTAAGVALLVILGVDLFAAFVHTLSGVSTGGFSTFDSSLAGLGPWHVQAAAMLVSLSGAISLAVYYRAFRTRSLSAFARNAEIFALLGLTAVFTLLLAASLYLADGRPLGEILKSASLMGLSAQTTTGYFNLDVRGLGPASKLVLMVSMLLGGTVGSTAGGIKLLRLLIFLRLLQLMVLRTCLPSRAVVGTYIEGQRVESDEIERALLTVLLFALVIVVSWVPFVVLGHDPLDSLFEVVSAMGTVGLSAGVASPGLEPGLKALLCVDMLFGRLEVFAFLVILYPGTWLGRKAKGQT